MKIATILSSLTLLPYFTLSASVVYEPFDDSDSSLNGNTAGAGLNNFWTAGSGATVTPGSLSYGSSPTSGHSVGLASGNSASVNLNNDLANAGLLANGASLWFSYIINRDAASSTNDQAGFSLGTSTIGTGNNLSMASGESGIGVFISHGKRLKGASWDNAISATGPNNGFETNTSTLIVGRIDWGNTAADNDFITLYLPDTDLVLPATPHAVHNAGALDQTLFDTVTISRKGAAGQVDRYDEIRFGGSAIDVSAVPEPSSRFILGFGVFGLMLTRRVRRNR